MFVYRTDPWGSLVLGENQRLRDDFSVVVLRTLEKIL